MYSVVSFAAPPFTTTEIDPMSFLSKFNFSPLISALFVKIPSSEYALLS